MESCSPAPASSCNIFSGGWSVLQICASGEQLTQTHKWAASVLGSWLSHCAGVPAPVHHTPSTPHSHLTLAYNPAHSDSEEGSLGIVSKMNIINRTLNNNLNWNNWRLYSFVISLIDWWFEIFEGIMPLYIILDSLFIWSELIISIFHFHFRWYNVLFEGIMPMKKIIFAVYLTTTTVCSE